MKKNRVIVYILCLVLMTGLWSGKIIYASSAALAFTKDKDRVEVGQSFVVTLTVESMAEFKDFQTYVAYDPKALELIDTGNYVTGSEGLVFISDIDGKTSNVHQYRMKFRAMQEGSSEIYVSDTVYIYEAATGNEMSVSKGTLQINVEPKEKQELNQGLGSLTVGEGTLQPEFDSKVTEYQVEVSEKTETLFLDAKAKLKADTVTIEGNTNLKEGDNTAKIIVTSKNGTKMEYRILIHKKSKEEEVLEKEEKETDTEWTENENKSRLTVQQEDEGIILKTNMYFRIVPVPQNNLIPEGYKEEIIKLYGTPVVVYMPIEDEASDVVLVYGKAEGNKAEAAFYTFDRVEETLQRYKESVPVRESTSEAHNYQKQIKHLYILIFILVACLLAMLLALIYIYTRREETEEEFVEEEDKGEPWM